MLLGKFKIKNAIYEVFGSYEIEIYEDYKLEEYMSPTYFDLTATKTENGKKESFKPKGETWAGRKYEERDMIQGFLCALIREDKTVYEKIYLADGLEKVVTSYVNDRVEAKEKDFSAPSRILDMKGDSYCFYFATDQFLYYDWYESVIMIRTDTREIVSDNYFAEIGMYESFDAIQSGEEVLLFGPLAEEYMKDCMEVDGQKSAKRKETTFVEGLAKNNLLQDEPEDIPLV